MTISPLDIKKQEFEKKFKGYDPDEVDSYLQLVAEEMEKILVKNNEYSQKVELLEVKLTNYTKIEDVLQDTLLSTQKSAEETKNAAEQKSKTILDEAEMRAQRLVADAREKLLQIQTEITDLRNQKEAFIINFKSLLSTQQNLLEMIEKRADRGETFQKIKMKPELSEEELDRVVSEFAAEAGSSVNESDQSDNKSTEHNEGH